ASPTPFHATKNIVLMLENAGFKRLYEELPWELQEGKKYYVTRNDSSVVAFTYPKRKDYVIVGSHTDSPTLKVKPNPVIKNHGVIQFGVEPYGGLLLSPWFDRDLSLAGKIHYLASDNIIKEQLVDLQEPIAIIPSLAIHLDDKANKEKTINKQTDIVPLIAQEDTFEFDQFLKQCLEKEGVEDIQEVYGFDLSFYDTQKASFIGLHKEFIASARLDNLLSCYIGLMAICSIDEERPFMFVANDHEEVGSESAYGAAGNFFESVYRRIFSSYEAYMQSVRSSYLVSCDNAHAIHPNFPQKHEPSHAPKMNEGVVIKINANQRYTSSSKTISRFLNVASALDIKTQNFVTRSDMGCGSTIGPITAAKIGLDTIDIGVPTLAMHSIRELAGIKDSYDLYKILTALSY
ncbi:MAG: M18 family aminopeptidase, partial [Epsilonproteobacteria bacterium]|nr:M18 family aminopeptidase [Campylobacterota bacterium]